MTQMMRILHPGWRNEYEATPYPFGDWASLANGRGPFIPEGTFLDATLYPIDGGPQLRLSKVVVSRQTITLYIGNATDAELCSGTLDVLEPIDDIPVYDRYGRPAGLLVSEINRLLIFQTWPPGTHEFTFAQTGFAAHVCLPVTGNYFRGFLLDDGSVLSGDIWLVGDDGIVLSPETFERPLDDCEVARGESPIEHRIRIDVVGDPLYRQRLCTTASVTPRAIKTVTFKRGCERIVTTPDGLGDIKITAGRLEGESTVLRVRNDGGNLRIETVGETLAQP